MLWGELWEGLEELWGNQGTPPENQGPQAGHVTFSVLFLEKFSTGQLQPLLLLFLFFCGIFFLSLFLFFFLHFLRE